MAHDKQVHELRKRVEHLEQRLDAATDILGTLLNDRIILHKKGILKEK